MIELRCPICGSQKIVYSEDSGEFVCANCGTVVMTSVEAEAELSRLDPSEFIKHQTRKTKTDDLIRAQSFTVTKHTAESDDSDAAMTEMKTITTRVRRTATEIPSDRVWYIIKLDKYYIVRIGNAGINVVAYIDVSKLPKAIEIGLAKASARNYLKYRRGRYVLQKHKLEFSDEAASALSRYSVDKLGELISKTIMTMLVNDPKDYYMNTVTKKALVNAIAHVLYRTVPDFPKPYKVVNGKPVLIKRYCHVKLDGECLSGASVSRFMQAVAYRSPQRAKAIKELIEEQRRVFAKPTQ